MHLSNSIISFRRHLKRRNCSANTLRSYLNDLKQFVVWVDQPIQEVTHQKIGDYIDHLLRKELAPKTINCHLVAIRRFYDFLRDEQELAIDNPVRKGRQLRLSKPLPKHLKDGEVMRFLSVIDNKRDLAIFMLMLRSGLRVSEVANLTLEAIDWRRKRIYIFNGKGGKDRVVYISNDSFKVLTDYIRSRIACRVKKIFLVERGSHKGNPLSVRGIQKRMEYYAKKTGLNVSCHNLRHTWADQMLNADAELETVQDLLGHSWITTTQRYCRLSNQKVKRDYFRAMEIVMRRTGAFPLGP